MVAWRDLIKQPEVILLGMDLTTKEAYEKMLEHVFSRIQRGRQDRGERVIAVTPEVLHERRQTIILNFRSMAQSLEREPEHLARFIFKESGKPGVMEDERLVISGVIGEEELARLLQLYYKEFVKCPVCGGIDTKLVAEKKFRFLLCEICGAKSPVRKI